jgi:phospholipid/cholesterol/gamma-HCH transport system permease protein
MHEQKPVADFKEAGGVLTISLKGCWVIDHADLLHDVLENLPRFTDKKVIVEGDQITSFDTLGAWLMYVMFQRAGSHTKSFETKGFQKNLLKLIERTGQIPEAKIPEPVEENALLKGIQDLGALNLLMVTHYGQLFTFIGFVLVRFFKAVFRPYQVLWKTKSIFKAFRSFKDSFRMTSLVYHIEEVGFKALAIVGVMSFLIGAVILNQGAIQLRQFGAEVFAIDLVAVSILREMGILLAAILIAGRSGSAFTAEIGSMKVREEIDAMVVLGLNPIDVLVLPRMLALILIMPFIAFFSAMMGALGGALMAWVQLDISFEGFWNRFRDVTTMTTFWIGIIKAPFFGAIIAINGCFEGMTVGGSAESVGRNTTRSVVQSIFMVIVLDAFMAMFFTAVGW